MDHEIIWTLRASDDVEAIVRYLTRRDPVAANRVGFGIFERVQILLQHPEAGSVLEELRETGWRKLIYRRWKIVYAVREQKIIIGRVWPCAMGEADLETPL